MILVVGLSPAWQRTLRFERLTIGGVNRTSAVQETAAGKGVNVVRVVHTLGGQARLITVAGGSRGRLLTASLRAEGLAVDAVRVQSETRICQTLLHGDGVTELVEEAGPLTPAEVAEVRAVFRHRLQRARLVVLSGSVPRGCSGDFYALLAREAQQQAVPVLVDAQGEQLLRVLAARPALVKVNRTELLAAFGGRNLRRAMQQAVARGAGWVVITHGPRDVLAFEQASRRWWRCAAVRLQAVNPIGSGDALLAGLAHALVRGAAMQAAIELGVACGAANALTASAGVVRRADVERFRRRVRCRQVE